MRIGMLLLGWMLAIIALAPAWRSGPAVDAANVGVTAANITFTPKTLTVATGDTVTWTFADSQHSVVADGGAFDSGAPQSGGTFAFTFNTAGTFAYYCAVHGAAGGQGMAGTITVEAAPTATATTAAPTATNTVAASATAAATTTGTPQATATGTPATATATGTATPAVSPSPTAVVPVFTPVVIDDGGFPQPAQPGSGSGGLPRVGDGASAHGDGSVRASSIALAVAGAMMAGAAILVRRRVDRGPR